MKSKIAPHRVSDRMPPQALDAEMAVLGSMIIERESVERVMDILDAKHFYSEIHAEIFRAIKDLYEKNSAVDLVTLSEELKKRNKLTHIGGEVYLSELAEKVSSSAHSVHYAKIVRDKSSLRNLISAATSVIETCYDEADEPHDILDLAQEKMLSVSQEQQLQGFSDAKELSKIVMERIEAASMKKEAVTGVPTGFTSFDNMTGGLQKSDFVILAARPSQGKTAMALNIAYHAVTNEKNRVPTAMFSLEMSKESIFQRLVCSGARAELQKVRTGMFEKKKWTDLTRELSKLAKAPLWIDDSPGLTITDIRMRARRLASELKQKGTPLGLVIVDYLQLIQAPSRKTENRQQEVSEISRRMKELARNLDIPVLALSQLNRKTEDRTRDNHRPQLSDLRESGSLEQDADLVALIHKDSYYSADKTALPPGAPEDAELIIAKQRNGPVGTVKLMFFSHCTRFDNAMPASAASAVYGEEEQTSILP